MRTKSTHGSLKKNKRHMLHKQKQNFTKQNKTKQMTNQTKTKTKYSQPYKEKENKTKTKQNKTYSVIKWSTPAKASLCIVVNGTPHKYLQTVKLGI